MEESIETNVATENMKQEASVIDPEPKLSKNKQKKLRKREEFEKKKGWLRLREKEKKKQKRILMLEQGIELVRSGPSRKVLKMCKGQKLPAEISVAIDLSFDDLMLDKDLGSCASQLLRVYTNNRRANRPIPVHFTGLKEGGKLYEKMERNDGWKNWDVVTHRESFMELFDKEKIIYLTSDSETVLETLEKDAVYVIGGLVDHNHHKFLTQELALKNCIRSARLPLSEYLIIKTRTVLTINQVFDIILGISEGLPWKEVLMNTLPQRKGIKLKEEDPTIKIEKEDNEKSLQNVDETVKEEAIEMSNESESK